MRDARAALDSRYPNGVGEEPREPEAARRAVDERMDRGSARQVVADDDGFLSYVRAGAIVQAATGADALVRQCVAVGDYVVPGEVLAEVWADDDDLVDGVRGHFVLASQRSHVQDLGFALRPARRRRAQRALARHQRPHYRRERDERAGRRLGARRRRGATVAGPRGW